MSPTGELLEFTWSPLRDWQVTNTGYHIAKPLTSWLARSVPGGPLNVEHLTTISPRGDLLVFFRTVPNLTWNVVNVSADSCKIQFPSLGNDYILF